MIPHLPRGGRFGVIVAIAASSILAMMYGATQLAGAAYRPQAGDDRPPSEPRYAAAMRQGLAGDYAGAEAAFVALARGERGTNAGAWALYQAALAAESRWDDVRAGRLKEELTRCYPGHPVVLRLTQVQPLAVPPRPRPDCGPRALQALCEEAGHPTSVEQLARLCGTDAHGTTLENLARAARAQGLRVAPAQVDPWYLRRHRPAGLAWVDGDHFVAFFPGPTPDRFWVADANLPDRQLIAVEKLRARCQGIVLLAAWGDRKLPPGLEEATTRQHIDPAMHAGSIR